MIGDAQQAAADILWKAWEQRGRIAALPEAVRPRTREEGYAIQALFERRSASPIVGWKIAATSKAGQAHIAVDGPLAGRLLGEHVFASGSGLRFGNSLMRVAEAEFAFRMAIDVPPRASAYSVDEVLERVATLHPSIEVPDSRYEDFTIVGAPQLIADNACAHDFVLGPESPDSWRSIDLAAHRVVGRVECSPGLSGLPDSIEREGIGSNVLGDPRIALAWLVNELSGLGITLRNGQIVTTGTCLVPLPIGSGDRVTCDFGVLGSVDVSFD
jgi:2-keto-4-pentenoate hydratase